MKIAVTVFAVVLIGLLAGLMLGTGMQNFTYRHLGATGWVEQHQAQDALFRRVMPTFFNVTLLLLAAAAVVSRGAARWWFAAAAVLALGCIVVTVGVEVPMNRQITSWDPAAVPLGWQQIRSRWLVFHAVRTAGGTLAFVCATLGALRR